jgi:membrane-bound lytic murein transglycosylase MltF
MPTGTQKNELAPVLAPSGKLKVGVYLGSPTSMVKDPISGTRRGLTVELGRELAKRLGVEVELKEYLRLAEIVEALKNADVDKSGTVIGVSLGSSSQAALGKELKLARLEAAPLAP